MRNPISRPRILLAEDHAGMLESVTDLLKKEFELVGAVSNGRLVLDNFEQLHPDLIVMDIAMPKLDGIRTARELRLRGCEAKIVFLTVQEDEDYISAALNAGASGYVLKSRMQSDLIIALKKILAGEVFVSRR